MNQKQKNEILTLLAAIKADLNGAGESLKQLSTLLRSVSDTAGAERAEALNREIVAHHTNLDDLIASYASLVDELRAQAARILRKSLDLNDLETQ